MQQGKTASRQPSKGNSTTDTIPIWEMAGAALSWVGSVIDDVIGAEEEEKEGKLNACLAFVSIHISYIMAEFVSGNPKAPSLDDTYVES